MAKLIRSLLKFVDTGCFSLKAGFSTRHGEDKGFYSSEVGGPKQVGSQKLVITTGYNVIVTGGHNFLRLRHGCHFLKQAAQNNL